MNVDWALLRAQKQRLLELDGDDELITGVIHFIDAFQDWSVDNGNATEEEVFGELR